MTDERTRTRASLLELLDERDMSCIRSRAAVCDYPRGAAVIRRGDCGEALYIILRGRVKIFVTEQDGKETLLGFEEAGGFFGEVAAVDHGPRSASVVTTTRARLLLLKHSDFRECIARRPQIALALMNGMTRRIRYLTQSLHDLRTRDVRHRLLAVLDRLACAAGGDRVVEPRPSHQSLADMVGASREMVGRVLRALVAEGCVRIEGRRLLLTADRKSSRSVRRR